MNRIRMIQKLKNIGFDVETTFNGDGPLLSVFVPFISKIFYVPVPVRILDDHTDSFEALFAAIGHYCQEQGIVGHA